MSTTFAALIIEHHDSLFARACHLCGDRAEADDLLHDALERALLGYSSMGDPQRASGWLLAILADAFVDRSTRHQARDTPRPGA